MADISSVINTLDTPTAGQTEGVITPMAAENNQTVEQDSGLTLDVQNDQAKTISTVSLKFLHLFLLLQRLLYPPPRGPDQRALQSTLGFMQAEAVG